jgi:hypothetical protein
MNSPAVERQRLIEAVNTLPDETLVELASFVEYLRYKSEQPRLKTGSDFLVSIVGLGASELEDLSEKRRDFAE